MIARKCDRCSSFYEMDYRRSKITIFTPNEPVDKELDLCPDCTAQLRQWIKNEAEFFERKETDG